MAPLATECSQAIDVMSGLTLALIVVNMSVGAGKSYAPLLNATWHGLTLTDLVLPSFLFIVGTALSFTIDRLGAAGTPALLRRVFRAMERALAPVLSTALGRASPRRGR